MPSMNYSDNNKLNMNIFRYQTNFVKYGNNKSNGLVVTFNISQILPCTQGLEVQQN